MIDFVFQNPAKIIFGRDALSHLGGEALQYGRKALLVYGGGSVKRTGLYDQVTAILQENGIQVWELPGIVPNRASRACARASTSAGVRASGWCWRWAAAA